MSHHTVSNCHISQSATVTSHSQQLSHHKVSNCTSHSQQLSHHTVSNSHITQSTPSTCQMYFGFGASAPVHPPSPGSSTRQQPSLPTAINFCLHVILIIYQLTRVHETLHSMEIYPGRTQCFFLLCVLFMFRLPFSLLLHYLQIHI